MQEKGVQQTRESCILSNARCIRQNARCNRSSAGCNRPCARCIRQNRGAFARMEVANNAGNRANDPRPFASTRRNGPSNPRTFAVNRGNGPHNRRRTCLQCEDTGDPSEHTRRCTPRAPSRRRTPAYDAGRFRLSRRQLHVDGTKTAQTTLVRFVWSYAGKFKNHAVEFPEQNGQLIC